MSSTDPSTPTAELEWIRIISSALRDMDIPTLVQPTIGEQLAVYFPLAIEGQPLVAQPLYHYSDKEIQEISSILRELRLSWSRVPRTYIILRFIGRLDLLDDLINVGFNDHWFPISAGSLPSFVESEVCKDFERTQALVLTKAIDLEKGENGKHWHFGPGEVIPLQHKELLGNGGYGQVDRVVSLISYKEYARKQIPRRLIFGEKSKEAMEQFATEVEILKRLRHIHIVKFIGSYTETFSFGLLMSPVADMHLGTYLTQDRVPFTEIRRSSLRSFFGCLATALVFLHSQNIRHKDIKPQNILIKGERVLLTDFGLSRDSTGGDGNTTSGPTALSPRYCAPEVAEYSARNASADIWSLGCVFFEILAVLKRWKVERFKAYFLEHGTKEPFIRNNLMAVDQLSSYFETIGLTCDNKPLHWIRQMLQQDRTARPDAATLVTLIMPPRMETGVLFSGRCCIDTHHSTPFHVSRSDIAECRNMQGNSSTKSTSTVLTPDCPSNMAASSYNVQLLTDPTNSRAPNYGRAISWLSARGIMPDPTWTHEEANMALFKAAECGQIDAVQYSLIQGAAIHATGDIIRGRGVLERCTALMVASLRGHHTVVKFLLTRGAAVNLKTYENGSTALMYAAEGGYERVAQLLLDHGAFADIGNKFDRTALSWAAYNGKLSVVKLLLNHEDVYVNSRDVEGNTPLSAAASAGYVEVVRLFLDKEDIDVNSKNNWGATPLILAAQNEHLPVVRLLAGRDDVDQLWTDRFGLTGAYSPAWSRRNSAWSGSSTWSEL